MNDPKTTRMIELSGVLMPVLLPQTEDGHPAYDESDSYGAEEIHVFIPQQQKR